MLRPQQQAVADKLREMILHGVFSGGDRLLEIPLSKELQVSRTPVREALITLSNEGLVEYRQNRGYVVRSFTPEDISNAYVVREVLEGLATRIVAENGIDRGARRSLEECLEEGDRILAVKRLTKSARDPWGEMNDRFHRVIVESTHNAALIDALSRATNIPYSSSRVVHWFDEDDAEGFFQLRFAHSQHHGVFEAICNGEGSRAELMMKSHIGISADHIRSKYFGKPASAATTMKPADDIRHRPNGGLQGNSDDRAPRKPRVSRVRA